MEVREGDPEDVVRSEILSVKLKSRQKIWRSGSLLSGELISFTPDNSVEFYVEQDMLHVRVSSSILSFLSLSLWSVDMLPITIAIGCIEEKRREDNR